MSNITNVERASERELVVTRTFNAPQSIVFEAWTRPELFQRWWAPKSMGMSLMKCEMDARTGGKYHLVFGHEGAVIFEAYGKYLEVTPSSRIVWTNDEDDASGSVTTVTFEDRGGKTLLVLQDLYPSKEALDEATASGSSAWDAQLTGETFQQLDDVLATLRATV
jgi:uncharacterized protein YndB with AHSA1/START domain